MKFSKVTRRVIVHGKWSSELTFENFLPVGCAHRARRIANKVSGRYSQKFSKSQIVTQHHMNRLHSWILEISQNAVDEFAHESRDFSENSHLKRQLTSQRYTIWLYKWLFWHFSVPGRGRRIRACESWSYKDILKRQLTTQLYTIWLYNWLSDILVFQDAVDEFARASRDLTKTFSKVSSLFNFTQVDYTAHFWRIFCCRTR